MLQKEKNQNFFPMHAYHLVALTATTLMPCLRTSMPYSLPYNCFSLCKAPRLDTPHFEPCAAAPNSAENGGLVKKSRQVYSNKKRGEADQRGDLFISEEEDGLLKEKKEKRARGSRESKRQRRAFS